MECKKCGKSINDLEIYCEECKNIIKKEQEFNTLVNKNRELNKLENTKEVPTLNDFTDEKKEDSNKIREELKNIVNFNDDDLKINNDSKAPLIIAIITILISISIIVIAVYTVFFKKEEIVKPQEENVVDYSNVIKEYGISLEESFKEYLKQNTELPSWSTLKDLNKYDKYNVICSMHMLYEDGTIYLNDCIIDGNKVEYSYGQKQETIKGKEINIHIDEEKYNNLEIGTLVGSVTCKTENCKYIEAYDNYVLVEEESEYYIYNYKNNSLEFGPFSMNNDYSNVLVYENQLYGIIYKENDIQKIYSFVTKKSLTNINGNILISSEDLNTKIIYKYGYAIFNYNNKNNFVNLKTGNVSYTIDNIINKLIEDSSKKLVYIIATDTNNTTISIYNSNGKNLFEDKEFNEFKLIEDMIILANNDNYYIYDNGLNLTRTSKKYNSILGLYDDFIVVVDNGYLEIVDLEDNIIATFDLEWDNAMYKFDNTLSGKVIENNEDIIYLIIERSNSSLKYYYNTVTKEFGLK